MRISASVEIRADPGMVFALVSDLRRKAGLNPNVRVIRVELEGEEPVREGSVFYHRLQRGQRIFEYRSRCLCLVPPRLFESRAETDPPFEVRVAVEPTPDGCRLTQGETLEVSPALLDALEPASDRRSMSGVLGLLAIFPGLGAVGSEVRRGQRDRLARRLTVELQAWLDAIKAHLEAGELAWRS
ncbi:MAG: SRPBCC family protein [Candidatus Rokubacteria bacterium]|nr:SRPBCC family protein [Candidatus Rokubacteria bacterium]